MRLLIPMLSFHTPASRAARPETKQVTRLEKPTAEARVSEGTTSNEEARKFDIHKPLPNPNPTAATFVSKSELLFPTK